MRMQIDQTRFNEAEVEHYEGILCRAMSLYKSNRRWFERLELEIWLMVVNGDEVDPYLLENR